MYLKKIFGTALLLTFGLLSYAQHESHEDHPGMKGSHLLTLGWGHTYVSQGEIDGKTSWLVLASSSLNYDYWLSDKWAIGLQNDMVLESFFITDEEGKEIERNYPLSMVPVAIYKPGEHMSFIGGVGKEFSKEQNITLTRLGLEYGFHLPKNWEVGATLLWDNKWNYYNSWCLAFTVSKIWPRKHAH